MAEPPHKIDLPKELARGLTVHTNIKQEMIVTTEDKVRLCLIHKRDAAAAQGAWIAPLALLITIILALVAADFHDFFLTKGQWSFMFVFAAGVVALWLVWELRRAWGARQAVSGDLVEGVVRELKSASRSLIAEAVQEGAQPPIVATGPPAGGSHAYRPVDHQQSEAPKP